MTGAIVISWGTPVRGREGKALEVFARALSYFEDLAKKGTIHGHREYLALTGNTSERGGLQVIDGELERLQKLQSDDKFQRLTIEAGAIVENFTVELCVGGSDIAIQQQMTRYAETLSGLGIL